VTQDVIVISDSETAVHDAGELLRMRYPEDLRVWPVFNTNPERLWCEAQRHVETYLRAGPGVDGLIVIDLHWGPGAEMKGYDFIFWLRADDYRQPIIIDSRYPLAMIRDHLDDAVGWTLLQAVLEGASIAPLTEEEAQAAQATAQRHWKPDVNGMLDRIWTEIKPELYGGSADWAGAAAFFDRLRSVASRPETTLAPLAAALGDHNAIAVRDALYACEQALASMEARS
jgi:hypothetical protein